MRKRTSVRMALSPTGKLALALVWTAYALASDTFDLVGQLQPKASVRVHLHGATEPFEATIQAGLDGKFRFRHLLPKTYVISVQNVQRTIEVSPALADAKHRVSITIELSGFETKALTLAARVSVGELSIPKPAQTEYEEAQKMLARRDVDAATAHLKSAVRIAPQFSTAWNNLGTIAYQSGHYEEAEADFQAALKAEPGAYAPLVNLGGVLLNLGDWKQALGYNEQAVAMNPNDALANSQLGISYFYLGQFDLAMKYLETAKRLDPAHFSHPQLLLAEIHVHRHEPAAAAAELQDLLDRHPNLENADKIRAEIVRLRAEAKDF